MNNNEMPKMNNNDALELANQMQRRKSSEEEFDDVLEVSEVDLERKRSFANWVLGEAKKHEDYLEFYEVAENKFFDLLMEKKDIVMGMASSQLVIRKEAIKLAKKENVEFVEATEKIYGILIQYQENDVVNYASRYDNKRTPEQKEIKNKQKKEIKEYFKNELLQIINDYYQKTGDEKIFDELKSIENNLMDLSRNQTGGALLEKRREVENVGITVENIVHYAFDLPLQEAKINFQSRLEMEKSRRKK